MPIAFLAALAGSLVIHAAALLGVDLDMSGPPSEPVVLKAELKPLPPQAVEAPQPVVPPHKPARKPKAASTVASPVVAPAAPVTEPPQLEPEIAEPEVSTATVQAAPPPPAQPLLPAKGVVRYAVYKSTISIQIGRAEQQWEFAEDGTYHLISVMETSGLAAFFKPTRIEHESQGRMVAGGLQPEHFMIRKNGRETNEKADFDWSTAEVRLARDSSVQSVSRGTQDLLSLNYQLAFLGKLEEGARLGVVTGKKYDRYAVDSLGEEEIEVPAGRFRTLHLRVQTETTMDLWIALEQRGLPVKMRFTDKKGDSFEQLATEIGM